MSGLPSGQEKRHDDTNHDGRFHELSQSRAEMWDDPQYTNRAEDETGSEYEHEIEYTGFQDLHDGLATFQPFGPSFLEHDLVRFSDRHLSGVLL